MIDTVLVSAAPGETRIALVASGHTMDVIHHRTGHESLAGAVYRGRVTALAAGLNGAFVDIGEGRPGLLNAGDARADPDAAIAAIGDYVHEGEAVVVQVRRDPMGDKGPRLTMRPALSGRYLVFQPGQGGVAVSRRITDEAVRDRLRRLVGDTAGVTFRTRAARAEDHDILAELNALRTRWDSASVSSTPARLLAPPDPLEQALSENPGASRVVVDTPALYATARRFCDDGILATWGEAEPLFEAFGVEAALDGALATRVTLPSGGVVTFEQTAALCAIDVDSAGHGDSKTVALDTNLEAAADIGRQLRLRVIGGVIVIDFISMAKNDHRRRVIDALRAALGDDRDAVAPGGFTRLGLVEMRRRRTRPSLALIIGDGLHGSALTVALAIARHAAHQATTAAPGPIAITAADDVAQILDATLCNSLAEVTGRAVTVTAESAYGRAEHDVSFG